MNVPCTWYRVNSPSMRSKIVEGQLAALAPGMKVRLRADGEARAMLLGGNRFPTPRHIWWNFVASSQERIERAKARWAKREFPPVPGETEFIPLPDTRLIHLNILLAATRRFS